MDGMKAGRAHTWLVRLSVALLSALGGAGCSTKAQSEGGGNGCLHGYDGCVAGSVYNFDTTPFEPANPARDGKGTLYVALLDQCPSLASQQFKFVSEVDAIENADLTTSQQYPFKLDFRFNDSRYSTTYAEGAAVALSGFLDDNLSIAPGGATLPDFGDTALGCLEVTLTGGPNQLVSPLAPCVVVDPAAFKGFHQPSLGSLVDQCAGFAAVLDGGSDAPAE